VPWYIPLLAAMLGASIGFASSFATTRYTFARQINREKINLLIAFEIEVSSLVQFLKQAVVEAAPNVVVILMPKTEFENLCVVYKSNCGKIGILSTSAASEIVDFYAQFLSLLPIDPERSSSGYSFDKLAGCIAAGARVQSTLKGMGRRCWEQS
jgi:hypothetical protein